MVCSYYKNHWYNDYLLVNRKRNGIEQYDGGNIKYNDNPLYLKSYKTKH